MKPLRSIVFSAFAGVSALLFAHAAQAAPLGLQVQITAIDEPVYDQKNATVSFSVTNNSSAERVVMLSGTVDTQKLWTPPFDRQVKIGARKTYRYSALIPGQHTGQHTIEIDATTFQLGRCVDPSGVHLCPVPSGKSVASETLSVVAPPAVSDISADLQNGKTNISRDSSSGMIYRLAGDNDALYAVSLNGGLWSRNRTGGAWSHLSAAPINIESIAVDPVFKSHLVAGTRGADVPSQRTGVFESTDGGNTWKLTLDVNGKCGTRSVPAVAVSPLQTVYAATACGLYRKPVNGSFSIVVPTLGVPILALAVSETKVWARSKTTLYVMDQRLSGPAQDKVIPATSDNGTTLPMPLGEAADYSLGAFDSGAYFVCCSNNAELTCGKPGDPNGEGVENRLLAYDLATDKWRVPPASANDKSLGCSGIGLGGARFVKTFTGTGGTLLGSGRSLVFGGAQELYQATLVNSDATITKWDQAATKAIVHSDMWDVLVSPDGKTEWVAGDGGVYERALPDGTWHLESLGLHTQHIQTLSVMHDATSTSIVYPTHDNGAWLLKLDANGNNTFQDTDDALGDVNWTVADARNPDVALAVRSTDNSNGPNSQILSFSSAVPHGQRALVNDTSRDSRQMFSVIQSLAQETVVPSALDAVMLANLPLYRDSKRLNMFPGPLGSTSGAVLLRNSSFVSSADIGQAAGMTTIPWCVIAANLPGSPIAFWTSGGHSAPELYLLTNFSGVEQLFKSATPAAQCSGGAAPIMNWGSALPIGAPIASWPKFDAGNPGRAGGPVYVNPYNAAEVYVLASDGVRFSEDGGKTFSLDAQLSNLVKATAGDFSGNFQPRFDGVSSAKYGIDRGYIIPSGAVVNIAFLAEEPEVAVAASPYGVFYRDSKRHWHDITFAFPQPLAQISDVGIDPRAIYISTTGGGLFRVTNYRNPH